MCYLDTSQGTDSDELGKSEDIYIEICSITIMTKMNCAM